MAVPLSIAKNKRLIILAVISAALIGGSYFLLYVPTAKKIAKLNAELKPLLAEIAHNQERIAAVPQLEERTAELKLIARQLDEKASAKEEIPKIIQQLARKMTEFNIEAISIKPREDLAALVEDLPEGVNKAFIEVKMQCVYKALGQYIEALDQLPILFTLEDITVEKAADSVHNDVRALLIISTYVVS